MGLVLALKTTEWQTTTTRRAQSSLLMLAKSFRLSSSGSPSLATLGDGLGNGLSSQGTISNPKLAVVFAFSPWPAIFYFFFATCIAAHSVGYCRPINILPCW